MLGTFIVFIMFLSDAIASFVPGEPETKPITEIKFGIVMPMLICLAMLRDLKQLNKFGFLGLAGLLLEVVGMAGGSIVFGWSSEVCTQDHLKDDSHCRYYTQWPPGCNAFQDYGVGCATFVFGLAVLSTVPSMRSSLAKPQEMQSVLSVALATTLIIYQSLMMLGYLAFGQKSRENAIVAVAETVPSFGYIGSAGLLLNVLFSFAIFFFVFINYIESTGEDALRTTMTVPNMLLRTAIVIVATIVSWLMPYIGPVIGIISSVFCVFNNFWFPIILFYVLRSKVGTRNVPVSFLRMGYHGILVCVGLLVLYFGFTGSLADLKRAFEEGAAAEDFESASMDETPDC